MQVRKSRAKIIPHEHKEGEEHSHDEEVPEENLPVLDDEFVKSLGMFDNVEDFKTKVRENIKLEKEHTEHEKNRLAIMEAIMAETTAEIPELLIDAELDKMLFRMKSDITNMGLQFEDYLKHMGKEESVMRTEFRDDAKKRVMMELILDTIGTQENIQPNTEKVEKDVTALMNMYKEADPNRTRAYVEHMTRTEQVFAFLENQK
jgi:trigger factor